MNEKTKERKPREPRDLSVDLGPEITAELDKVLRDNPGLYNIEGARNRVRQYAQQVAIQAVRGYVEEIVRTGGKSPAARRAPVTRAKESVAAVTP